MSLLNYFICIIILKVIQSNFEDKCSEKNDCFNCTFILDCKWKNNECINITDEKYIISNNTSNKTNDISSKDEDTSNEFKFYKLFDTDNQTILFYNLKYLKNTCYQEKIPFKIEENNINDNILEKYCGKKNIVITNEMLINGYKIQLNNINGKFGFSNIICQFIIISGGYRNDVDIYINQSLSKDFLLFYTPDYNNAMSIKYSCTISLDYSYVQSVSFLFFSNKSFDSIPFIINIKDYKYIEFPLLDILFLLLIIFFVVGIISSIIFVRYKSNFFNVIENKYQNLNNEAKKNEINSENENKINLNVINGQKNEDNSLKNKNDEQEIQRIKSSNSS